MIEINKEYEVTITDIDNKGNGIGRIDNFVIFIKGCLTNEKIKIKIIKINKHYAIGTIVNIIEKSNLRENILCPYFYECGGCCFLHVSKKIELEKKEQYLKSLFPSYKVLNITSNNKLNYRNKVTFHVKNGTIGFFKKDSNSLIEINNCLILNKNINNIIKDLKKLNLLNVKEITIRYSYYEDKLMIIIIGDLAVQEIEKIKDLTKVSSIYLNNDNVYGNDYITETINNIKYVIYPNAFFQVNTSMIEILYNHIKENIKKSNSLLDLYCGTGTIGIYVSSLLNSIYGIDNNIDAIKSAKLNKRLNNIKKIDFICNDASILNKKTFDILIIDPPRSGLSKKVIDNIKNINSKKIIYVSCNPITLKRDLELLKEKYDIKKIIPVNMFYRTEHVECVTILCLK